MFTTFTTLCELVPWFCGVESRFTMPMTIPATIAAKMPKQNKSPTVARGSSWLLSFVFLADIILPKLHYKIFAQVDLFNHWVADDFAAGAVFQNFAIVQNITAVGNAQCFTHIMVGYNHAQPTIL